MIGSFKYSYKTALHFTLKYSTGQVRFQILSRVKETSVSYVLNSKRLKIIFHYVISSVHTYQGEWQRFRLN